MLDDNQRAISSNPEIELETVIAIGIQWHTMNESNLRSLESVLRWSKDTGKKLRFFGHAMVILAEALVAEVGDDIVALKHQEKEEPSEFLVMSEIVKTQILGESHHF